MTSCRYTGSAPAAPDGLRTDSLPDSALAALPEPGATGGYRGRTERSFPQTTSRYVEVYWGVQVVSVR